MKKTVIITGANRGLGYETAKALAANHEWMVLLACRDMANGGEAIAKIMQETGHLGVAALPLNLASLQSVRDFVALYKKHKFPPLKSIVCNAGVNKTTVREKSVDGYEQTFAINHLGHFLLVHLLLEQLTPPARILFVSSSLHDAAEAGGPILPPRYVNAELAAYPERDPDLLKDDMKAGEQAYSTSKLCNMMCTLEFARQLERAGQKGITVNAFNPGLMAGTGLGREGKGLMRVMWYYILPLLRPLMGNAARTVQQSGADLAHLVTALELASVTGTYFDGREVKECAAEARDGEKLAELWQGSISLTGLQAHETMLPIADS